MPTNKVTESAVVEDLLKKMQCGNRYRGNITVNGRAITKILVDGRVS